jgi:hypothetical protein
MTIKSKITNCLSSILNRKNYKTIIIALILIIFVFLSLGNYNLVFKEGLSLEEELQHSKNEAFEATKEANKKNATANNYADAQQTQAHDPQSVIESFDSNNCGSNYSNLGVPGNSANIMANTQCEAINKLKDKNKTVLANARKNNT